MRQTGTRLLALACLLGAACLCTGCYSRVVGARGPGADEYAISEPYQQDTKLDKWFYGERQDARNGSKLNKKPR